MSIERRLWILGAPDPEMEAIERLLRSVGEEVRYATVAGRRVRPDQAYQADPIDFGSSVPQEAVMVECFAPVNVPTVVIDHHRPGDPGYGQPPSDFLRASSIGQVIAMLAKLNLTSRHWSDIIESWRLYRERLQKE